MCNVAQRTALPASSELFGRLRRGYGIDLEAYRAHAMWPQLARRMADLHIESVSEYVELCGRSSGEAQRLLDALLNGSTSFFREPQAFHAMQCWFSRECPRGDDDVRAWVAGCSSGEEAYSVAIALQEAVEARGERRKVRVFATDVRQSAVQVAQRGWYPARVSAQLTPERLNKHFVEEAGGHRVRPALRAAVVFGRHDLLMDPPFAKLDFVSCRNVLLYLDAAAQRNVLQRLHYALRPWGTLLLGSADSVSSASDLYMEQSREHSLYRRAQRRQPSHM
jgi:two-component system CheB/CheR fusion protein